MTAPRYVILTSRRGEFHTEPGAGMTAVESWDYLFYGAPRAHFVIAALEQEGRVRVVEDTPPHLVNHVPTKFLEKYDSVDAAREALRELARFGSMQIELVRA
ncbi:ferredoxin [Cupriavidus sp. AU9028]|uniref:ferredoxin n=1 Tax=Cupriavidus sp. AU9028 TaxID=2871157 RepID=UPI001C9706F0|nr:ferredoxin [Cupriavidus sp. AU9028]MBY4899075.1 ferredoxin [Cupriavidus sp. AU9028]